MAGKTNGGGEEGGSGVDLVEEARVYLDAWARSKKGEKGWKFRKVRQVWLLMNMYNPNKVEKELFRTLLEYLDGLKGASRDSTLAEARAVLAGGVPSEEELLAGTNPQLDAKAVKRRIKLARIRFSRADAIARVLA